MGKTTEKRKECAKEDLNTGENKMSCILLSPAYTESR
jgi:hypothetical protein